jgi:uncharacterized protein
LEFEWDEAKNRANFAKHGIWFEDAVLIWAGPFVDKPDNRFDYGERRSLTLGLLDELVVLAVVSTDRIGRTRIISARLASRAEREEYHEQA